MRVKAVAPSYIVHPGSKFFGFLEEPNVMTKFLGIAVIAASFANAAPALAQYQSGNGPVATACQQDIEKLCAGKEHGQGAVRACLETNKANVSADCANALDSTGPGRRP